MGGRPLRVSLKRSGAKGSGSGGSSTPPPQHRASEPGSGRQSQGGGAGGRQGRSGGVGGARGGSGSGSGRPGGPQQQQGGGSAARGRGVSDDASYYHSPGGRHHPFKGNSPYPNGHTNGHPIHQPQPHSSYGSHFMADQQLQHQPSYYNHNQHSVYGDGGYSHDYHPHGHRHQMHSMYYAHALME